MQSNSSPGLPGSRFCCTLVATWESLVCTDWKSTSPRFPAIIFWTHVLIISLDLASIVSQDAYLSAAQLASLSASADRYGALSLLTLSVSALFNSLFLPQLLSRISSSPRNRYGGLFSWVTHRNTWFIAQVVFSVGLYTLLLTESTTVMIVAVSFIGFSWAVTQWLPLALISVQVKMMSENQGNGNGGTVGAVLGIHNVFIAAPQILASLEGTIIFGITGDGDDSGSAVYGISWILMGSGLVSVVAALMVLRLGETRRIT